MIHWKLPSKYGRKSIGPSSGSAETQRRAAGMALSVSNRCSDDVNNPDLTVVADAGKNSPNIQFV